MPVYVYVLSKDGRLIEERPGEHADDDAARERLLRIASWRAGLTVEGYRVNRDGSRERIGTTRPA